MNAAKKYYTISILINETFICWTGVYIMMRIIDMLVCNLEESIESWKSMPELNFSAAFDTEERLTRFFYKNDGLSSVAKIENEIVGALLCGNDGRRGFFYHIGVKPQLRKLKIRPKWSNILLTS